MSGSQRKYSRYDPVTGRKVSVTEDDPRYQDWPSRKPSAAQKRVNQVTQDPGGFIRKETEKAVGKAVGQGITKARPAIVAAVTKYAPTALKLSLIGAAGYAAYWLTSKLQTVRFKTWDDLQYELANRVRHARQAAAAEYGRPLTPEEIKAIDTWYRAARTRLQEQQAAGRAISTFKFGD